MENLKLNGSSNTLNSQTAGEQMYTGKTFVGFDINSTGTSSTTALNLWSTPERLEVNEIGDTIEMIYKEVSAVTYTVYPSRPPQERIFKIIYSCKDGKWDKSERIYGKEIKKESYYVWD